MTGLKVALLGATGSIGTQTLDVLRQAMPWAKVTALTGNNNIKLLAKLAQEFRPGYICVPDEARQNELAGLIDFPCEILTGATGLEKCAAQTDASVVVNALVGRVGLAPTLAAINAGKHVAIANKETLVTAGAIVMPFAKKMGVCITPIDSEHSAILQCLQGNPLPAVEKIVLTASGGPFRKWDKDKIAAARQVQALKHPNWGMGPKITIDSATLMNKGLELIEAMWLYSMPVDKIEVVIHPQSIIHSMVQFTDGAMMAQMGPVDMRLPIQYALTAPDRIINDFPRLDLLACGELTFEPVDMDKFPCLALAVYAAKAGGTLPAVMNYINEWAVSQFLEEKISFYGISDIIARAFGAYTVKPAACAQDIWEAEAWADEFIKVLPKSQKT
ncbi:MAG: 1-deoxy-D-xylulose-5-phosphate reductoisomerase [Defluviitaleaceae bacterium]|nr:1-deoxy-D-xylulose-5-phosphate reductoisomerase [Defluviitaleaceae bacterium]